MIDTERFHLGPHTVRVVGAIAAELGRERPIHALEIATHLPLDVESIARILDSLEAEGAVSSDEDTAGFKRIIVDGGELYEDLEPKVRLGQHLEDPGFVQNLVALRADHDWCRKVRDQHRVLRAAATLGPKTELTPLAEAADIPPARVRAVLGDLEAEGYARTTTEGDDLRVETPAVEYPPARFVENDQLLTHVETRVAPIHRFWWVLLAIAAALLVLFIASRLAAP